MVRVGHGDKLNASTLQARNVSNDILRSQCNVLHTRSVVEVNVLLDLAFPDSFGWFVNRHFDGLIGRSHYDALEGRVVSTNIFVVDRPEAVETQRLLVVVASSVHL